MLKETAAVSSSFSTLVDAGGEGAKRSAAGDNCAGQGRLTSECLRGQVAEEIMEYDGEDGEGDDLAEGVWW